MSTFCIVTMNFQLLDFFTLIPFIPYANLSSFLILSNTVYFVGILGIILNRRNFLITMLFIEVMYVGVFLYLTGTSVILNNPEGQLYSIMVLITAACESAVGLSILLILFRQDQSIHLKDFTYLRG